MGRAPEAPAVDAGDAIERIRHAVRRLIQAIAWARAVNEVWRTFNRHEARQDVADSPASPAAHVYERATLDAQIMMVSRAFDALGRGQIMLQNRLSFPVCRVLLQLPNVMETLQDQSENWNELGADNRNVVVDRHQAFVDSLSALETERPNRIDLVRGFRDENITHELRFDVLPQRPQYDHIHGLVDEASALIGHLAMVANGTAIHWGDGDVNRSATWLWDAVAQAHRDDD